MKYYCTSLPDIIRQKYEAKNLPHSNIVQEHKLKYHSFKLSKQANYTQFRPFMGWLNNIFNQVDHGNISN